MRWQSFDIFASKMNSSPRWPQETGEAAQCCGLASAIAAENCNDLARFDIKGYTADDLKLAIRDM
jgi:hypothetical protein